MKFPTTYSSLMQRAIISFFLIILGFSPCGLKQSLKTVFQAENLCAKPGSSINSCQFVRATEQMNAADEVSQKLQNTSHHFFFNTEKYLGVFLNYVSGYNGVTRSVPLYILYQQLRASLF